MCVVNRSNSR